MTAPALPERRSAPRGLRPGLALLVNAVAFDSRETEEPLGAHAYSIFEGVEIIGSGPHAATLNRLFQVLEALPATRAQGWRAAILANLFAVVTRGWVVDFEHAVMLARLGPRHVASVQRELDEVLGIDGDRPLTTTAIRRLSREGAVQHELLLAGHAPEAAAQIAGECAAVAFRLLLAGVDTTEPAPIPRTAERFRAVVERGGVDAWRGQLANIAVHPWGFAAIRLEQLAEEAGLPDALRAIQACTQVYRQRAEDDERLTVAREIRQLVELSGRTQREFARSIGTSAPRLSTYVNGVVVPSSTMLLRMKRASVLLAGQTR